MLRRCEQVTVGRVVEVIGYVLLAVALAVALSSGSLDLLRSSDSCENPLGRGLDNYRSWLEAGICDASWSG